MNATPAPVTDPDEPANSRIGVALIAWMLFVTVLGAGVRLHELDRWSLWEDELYSVRSSLTRFINTGRQVAYAPILWSLRIGGADVSAIIHPDQRERIAQGYPPADDWKAAGINAWNMRLVTCLTGIASIPLLMFFSVRLLGSGGASILGLLLALSPWHVFWSQASRFYAQQFLFYNLALIFYFTATRRGSNARFVIAMVMLVLAILSQPPALLLGMVFVGDYLLGLIRRQPPRIPVVGWVTLALAGLTAVLMIYRFVTGGGFDYWGGLEGQSPQMVLLGSVWRNEVVIVAAAGLSFLGLWRVHPRLVPYLAMAAVLPVLVLVAIAMVPNLYSHTRYTFVVHYAWLALASLGMARVYAVAAPPAGRFVAAMPVAIAATAMSLTLFTYFTEAHGQRARYAEAFAYIERHRQPGEAVAPERVLIATYYLQTTDLAPFPRDRAELLAITEPTWLVMLMDSARQELRFPYIHHNAELREFFDVRAMQPTTSIRVYYFRPRDVAGEAAEHVGAAEPVGTLNGEEAASPADEVIETGEPVPVGD